MRSLLVVHFRRRSFGGIGGSKERRQSERMRRLAVLSQESVFALEMLVVEEAFGI